jgi:hypothetical protein
VREGDSFPAGREAVLGCDCRKDSRIESRPERVAKLPVAGALRNSKTLCNRGALHPKFRNSNFGLRD